MRKKHQVFAVLRIDKLYGLDTPIEDKVVVKQVVSSRAIAEREVKRLTRINGGKRCRYYWQATRFVELPEDGDSE